jgi:hypothetical protein
MVCGGECSVMPLCMQCALCCVMCVCRSLVEYWESKMCKLVIVIDLTIAVDEYVLSIFKCIMLVVLSNIYVCSVLCALRCVLCV